VEKPQQEQPSEKPPEAKPAVNPKVVSGGKGGRSDADAAASTSSAAKRGSAGTGSAAVSKYPGLVQKALRRALRYPKGAGRAGGEAHVEFTVSAAGKVSGIRVVVSTGNATLDAEAVRTVKRAAPFPAIPADAGRRSWTFTMPLLFKR
jgi:protein TonB